MPIERSCQICLMNDRRVPAVYDAKTIRGPWAYLCERCFHRLGHPAYQGAATKLSEVK